MKASARGVAELIARAEAEEARARFAEAAAAEGVAAPDEAMELAAALEVAYPAFARSVRLHVRDVVTFAREGLKVPRDARTYRRLLAPSLASADAAGVRAALRRFATREKLRIAARELLQPAGADVDVTARELSDLADVCTDVALAEAREWAEGRFGVPTTATGERCLFAVVGMGKLGGRELNAGSDIDLLLFYETDEGDVRRDGVATDQTLHEHFARITQRLTATLEEPTDDGFVFRVDLRLRPEGSRGPLVNALAAAERYYETWGRTWERAALLRARPMAGDIAFGAQVLAALSPFVWRREVNPSIAEEMHQLVLRSRTELAVDLERDLKLGRGGIREVEFFAQSLQLIWGGREPIVRTTNTIDALRRLRARGLLTDKEGREMSEAYLTLRRLEHRVQFATGLQTHRLPDDESLLSRIARSVGFATTHDFWKDLEKVRRRVTPRFASLLPRGGSGDFGRDVHMAKLLLVLDEKDEAAVVAALPPLFGAHAPPEIGRNLLALAVRPDSALGAGTRDRFPDLAPALIDALAESADPDQATRFMAQYFARVPTPGVYTKAMAEDLRLGRRLASLFGASAFLGQAVVQQPELGDRLLFGRGRPSERSARAEVDAEVEQALKAPPGSHASVDEAARPDPDAFVGALRRAKANVTMEVGLADLAGELTTRDCTLVLSALADAELEHALSFALRERGRETAAGIAVVAMGKLGGREVGYGSDLDIFFVYDDAAEDAAERWARIAQRVLRLVSTPHGAGPGYELDTRLRPSGNHGLLVASLESFARYHRVGQGGGPAPVTNEVDPPSADWERQALVRARPCAGDAELGAKVVAVATQAAYLRPAPAPDRVHHLRMRMEKELAGERLDGGRRRYDLKLGRGGLVDVEFAVQWLQMKHGADARVRTPETELALGALEAAGYIDGSVAAPLREGYRFLRRLEQRLRVLHGTSTQLIEEGAPGLAPLARRMGMRDGPRASAAQALLERYETISRDVRAAYLAVLGVGER